MADVGRAPAVPAAGRAAVAARGRGGRGGRGAAAAAAAQQQVAYHDMLRRLALSDNAIAALEGFGLDTLESFIDLTDDDIPAMVKELRRTGTIIRQSSQNFLSALRYWVMRQTRLQQDFTPDNFTDAMMRYALRRWQISQEKTPDNLIKAPDEFKSTTKWRDFREAFVTFMSHTKGHCDFPLSYVLREQEVLLDEDQVFETEEALDEAMVPLRGPYFEEDNRAVFDALKSRLLSGPAWTWIQDHDARRDGRAAWKALYDHFEGVGGQIRMKTAAYASIKRAEYKGAKNFDFDMYKRIHTQAHADLKRYGEPVPEMKKVKDFLDGITEITLQPVKYTIAGFLHLMNNFSEAANYIGQIVDINKKNDTMIRTVSSSSSSSRTSDGSVKKNGRNNGRGGRGGRGRGRGGRGGRGGRSNTQSAGRWISYEDWQAMPDHEKEKIRNERSNYAAKRKISGLSTSASEDPADDSNTTPGNRGSQVRPRAEPIDAGDQMSRRNRSIGQIRSGARYTYATTHPRFAASVERRDKPSIANAELDSHADTIVAGATCKIIEYTNQHCQVHPYADHYEPISNVPVVKAATAYDHPSTGETFILIFGQALYMGDHMDHTLICPNQARTNGVIIDDVPQHLSHDKTSTHSIYFPEEQVRIPLQLKGVISYITTRYPSDAEINDCRWLVVSNDLTWNPYDDSFAEYEAAYVTHAEYPNVREHEDRNIMSFNSALFRNISSLSTGVQQLSTSDEQISKIFCCSHKTAIRTRQVTTQKGIRSMSDHLTRRYRTKQAALRYPQLGGRHGRFYSDTMFASVSSIRNNNVAQIFVNDLGFTRLTPLRSKSEAGHALLEFIQDVGIPSALHTDNAKEMTTGLWERIRKDHQIKQTVTEPFSPFQNKAEIGIKEVKKQVRHLMSKTKTPKRLWDFCAQYASDLRNLTALPLFGLHGRTPYEAVTGNTPDISEFLYFSWYQPIYYYDPSNFPEDRELIGRFLGVAHNIGQALCFWILPKSGRPIARTTVRPITEAELQTNDVQQELKSFNASIDRKIGDHLLSEGDLSFTIDSEELQRALEDVADDDNGNYQPIEPEASRPEIDDYDEETIDKLLSAEVLLPKGDLQFVGKVINRKRDADGNPIGRASSNPILDTRVYEVEFSDGTIADYSANVIAEALYSQVDVDGNRFLLLKEIISHEKDTSALSPTDESFINGTGSRNPIRKITTKGWKFECLWADGSTSWEPLRNLKDSNPIELVEYAQSHGLMNEPAFAWWAKDVLQRMRRLISKVKTRYWQRTHKFGIRMPKTVAEALKLDAENGNTLWHDAIQKELKNVQVAFKFLEEGETVPRAHKEIPCHLIFDIKMDFTRKARFVAGGHKTDPPLSILTQVLSQGIA